MTRANKDEVVTYWHNLANQKWKTAEALMQQKRYADALFFCHLTLEADLKHAVVEATGEHAPLIHDLSKLATLAGLPLDMSTRDDLQEISTFNIAGRYDDYKLSFYTKATKAFAGTYMVKTKAIRVWIKKSTHKKK